MTRTYNRTTFTENLAEVKVTLFVYENSKYTGNVGEERMVQYTGLKQWSIVDGEDAKEIEEHTDGSCIDEMHEYLVLEFTDGTTSTFRNSHVDMFLR